MEIGKRFIAHLDGKRYCHFWLIPSIEIDYEHFKTQDYEDFQWTHICCSWLVWSLDVELTKKADNDTHETSH